MQFPFQYWAPFPDLDWIAGGISLRSDGGMSWNGMRREETVRNRREYFVRHGLNLENAVAAQQVHGCGIQSVASDNAGSGIFDPESRLPATDGLITRDRGLILTTLHADCAPIYFADTTNRVIALAHAGWRGILTGLPSKMIRQLESKFNAIPRNLRVAVGPMISPSNYEVDPTLAAQFATRFGDAVVASHHGRNELDLFAALALDLREARVRHESISPRPPCTAANDDFFSYRRERRSNKSMIAWLTIL